jgi:hypothetical protein
MTSPVTVTTNHIVSITPSVISRDIVAHSGAAIQNQTLTVTNTTTEALEIAFPVIGGLQFSPNSFPLGPKQSQQVVMTFDQVVLGNLPSGENTVQFQVTVSSGGSPIITGKAIL